MRETKGSRRLMIPNGNVGRGRKIKQLHALCQCRAIIKSCIAFTEQMDCWIGKCFTPSAVRTSQLFCCFVLLLYYHLLCI